MRFEAGGLMIMMIMMIMMMMRWYGDGMIMEAESLRPIRPTAEYEPYGACTTSFEQKGGVWLYVCTYVCVYVCMYVYVCTFVLNPCRIYACTRIIVQNVHASVTS